MKKFWIVTALIAALSLVLCGCGGSGFLDHPDVMADGTLWDESWTPMAGSIGVEQPGGDFQLLTTNGTLENMTVQYATWVCGAEQEIDKGTYVYDGQIYLMTEICESAGQAAVTAEEWHGKFGGELPITERGEITVDGTGYELLFYDCLAEGSHFSRGVTAIWTHGNMVLVVDIACVEGLDLDLAGIMEHFIGGIHYA